MELFQKIICHVQNGETSKINAWRLEMMSPFSPSYSWEQINEFSPKQASVLILWHKNKSNNWQFPLILRSLYDGVHSGQVGLPGGRLEPLESPEAAAKRETKEEIGAELSDKQIIYKLQKIYLPVSNFIVFPFISFLEEVLEFKPNLLEIQRIFCVDLESFLDDKYKTNLSIKKNEKTFEVRGFSWQAYKVWGLTAMILNEIRNVLKD